MILIYNLSGLLIGAAGLVLGLLISAATGHLWIGVLIIAAVWAGGGMWWRSKRDEQGRPRPFPSIFFIPLPFLAPVVAVLAVTMFFAERGLQQRSSDPRNIALKADDAAIGRDMLGGDATMSDAIYRKFMAAKLPGAVAADARMFTRVGADAVLILVKISNLKQFSPEAKAAALDAVAEAAKAIPGCTGKKLYIGIKGKLAFGAVRTPTGSDTGAVVSQDPLFMFYGPPPASPAPK